MKQHGTDAFTYFRLRDFLHRRYEIGSLSEEDFVQKIKELDDEYVADATVDKLIEVRGANRYFDTTPPRAHSQAELDTLFRRTVLENN